MARHRVAFFFAVLFLVIVGILGWQWYVYAGGNTAIKHSEIEASQQIMIETHQDSLEITQVFQNIPSSSSYKVIAPPSAQEWKCVSKTGKPCQKDPSSTATFIPEGGELRIQYHISVGNQQDSLLLSDWTIALEKVNIQSTKIEIVDKAYRKGTWVTPYPLKGHRELMYIDYSVFEGKGGNPSLYWQRVPLYLNETARDVLIYSENQNEKRLKTPRQSSLEKDVPLAIIKSTRIASQAHNGIVITSNDLTEDTLQKIFVSNEFTSRFKSSKQAQVWLTDVFLSFETHQQPVTQKGLFISAELQKQLNQGEMDKFLTAVLKRKMIEPQNLDATLGRIKGGVTHFFFSNAEQNQALIPLDFYDKRRLHFDGKEEAGLRLLHNDQKLYFPFIKTMNLLGYQVQVNRADNSFVVKKAANQYVFYLNEHRFLFNGEKYGLLHDPFFLKDGIVYISQEGFQSIFKIKVAKTDSDLYLTE